MNNQKGFVNVFVVIVGVALVGVAGYYLVFRKYTSPAPNTQVTQTPKPQIINDCYKIYGYTDPKITMANVTLNYAGMSKCIIQLAVDSRNPTICDIEGWSAKAECKGRVVIEEKVDKAAGMQDLSLCDVNGWDYKYDCQDRIYAKFGKCLDSQLTPPVRKVSCFTYRAIEKNDATICDGIKGINIKGWEGEQAFCYHQFATEKNDYRHICEKVASIANSSRDWFAIRMANQCYYDAAKISNDESLCTKILVDTNEGKSYADGCYNTIGVAKKDAQICGKINGKKDARYCYYKVATDTNSSSVCGKISDGEDEVGRNWKLICYSDLSIKRNDESVCDNLGNLTGMPSGDGPGSEQSLKFICRSVFESKGGKSF